jgi:hypothetical protein
VGWWAHHVTWCRGAGCSCTCTLCLAVLRKVCDSLHLVTPGVLLGVSLCESDCMHLLLLCVVLAAGFEAAVVEPVPDHLSHKMQILWL